MSIYDLTAQEWSEYHAKKPVRVDSRVDALSERYQSLLTLRKEHGYTPACNTKEWSKKKIAEIVARLPVADGAEGWLPKNALVLNLLGEKFARLGFQWMEQELDRGRKCVLYVNYPKVCGIMPTLFDLFVMPVELADGYQRPVDG